MTTSWMRQRSSDLYQQYQQNGYVVLRGVLDAGQLEQARHECDRLVALCSDAQTKPERTSVQWEVDHVPTAERDRVEGAIRQIEPVVDISPLFASFAGVHALRKVVEMVLGDHGVIFESKLNLKPPGGSGFGWHQDWSCCWRAYTDELVTCLIFLDEANEANGCLQVVPTSHRERRCLPFREKESGEEHFEVDPGTFDHRLITPLPLGAGDMVAFDPYLLHYSARNRTENWRRALILTFNPARLGTLTPGYGANRLLPL